MTNKHGKILIIDDNQDVLFALKLLLKQHYKEVVTSTLPNEIPVLLTDDHYDAILLDMNFSKDASSGKEGFFWLEKILTLDPEAVVIFITAYGDAEKAVRAIKAGATDFVLKPWQNEKLLATLNSAVNLGQSRRETRDLRSRQRGMASVINKDFKEFVGNSPEMKKVFQTIAKVAPTDANILILGENGTGKELVARAIHNHSPRKDEVMISVDLGAIPESLFESELFGHEKGSFTDAVKEKQGRFEIAHGGTLFLDEIGNLSMPMQSKLLTAIEKLEITRVGAVKPRKIDVRLICATNAGIRQMAADNLFRQDLLYRINTVEIILPPLRQRTGDIALLARHFLAIYARKYRKTVSEFTNGALAKLESYHWPGNVRELQHIIERAVIMSDCQEALVADDLFIAPSSKPQTVPDNTGMNLEDMEKSAIVQALQKHSGNISLTAKELGLTRASLYRRMQKHGI